MGYQAYGKTHEYFPLIFKEKYTGQFLKNFVGSYFGGSYQQLVSFFSKEENMNLQELDELIKHLKKTQYSRKINNLLLYLAELSLNRASKSLVAF